MNEKKDISFLLKAYSVSQSTAQFELIDFCLFVQKYASKHSEENKELAIYENIGTQELAYELEKLKDAGEIDYITHANGNASIIVSHFYVEKLNKIFKSMSDKINIPFPTRQDLPKDIPNKFLKRLELGDDFAESKQNEEVHEIIYELNFGSDLSSLVFPSTTSTEKLLFFSLLKLRDFLEKDDMIDYIHKRLLTANPGKNFTIKTFISKITQRPDEAIESIKEANEIYLLWGQLCTFIVQEFNKKSEKLAEEISLLQGIRIIEFLSTYYRTKNQKKIQKETALKNLKLAFQKPPYYFTLLEITNFSDSRGIPLLGQYEQADLQEYLNHNTSETSDYSLPNILMFKNENGETFFVLCEKVIALIIFLVNQNRKKIRETVLKDWKACFTNFEENKAMKDDKTFELYLKNVTKTISSNLYALLEAKFLASFASDRRIIETQAIEYSRVFPQGRLAPYSKLLLLQRAELLRDTKILLPFWYSIPILYGIVSFFKRKRIKKVDDFKSLEEAKVESEKSIPKPSLQEKAKNLEEEFLPKDLNYDEAMRRYLGNWNQNLSEVLRNNLTEDVNSLIRDYVRSLQRAISITTLDAERIRQMAKRITNTPSLQKISDKKSLQKYCELYILKLLQKFF